MVVTARKHLVSVKDTIGKEIRVRVRELVCSPDFATAFFGHGFGCITELSEPLFPPFDDGRIG